MIEINFRFKGAVTKIQCNTNDKIIDICKKLALKIEEDINEIYFLYDGSMVDLSDKKLRVGQLLNNIDKSSKIMEMIVNKNNTTIINNNHKSKSKVIICPNCNGNSRIKIEEYKITLFECEDKHTSGEIFFKDFENTQYIDESKIKCDICRNNNKADTFGKKFYKCNSCKLNLCPLCKGNHDKNHYIIDYEQKNYYCDIHPESYNSYCKDCKKNLCLKCEKDHKKQNHEILFYSDLLPEENAIKKELDEFKILINKVENEIKEIKIICDKFIENIETYYTIYSDIINTYNSYSNNNSNKRNYQILKNVNDIKDKIITNDIKEIASEKNDISSKFNIIYKIFNKMITKSVKNEAKIESNFKKIEPKKKALIKQIISQ